MSDADETSSIESTPGTLASDLFSHGKKQLDNSQSSKTNEKDEHGNRELIENIGKAGKDAPTSENSIIPEENVDKTVDMKTITTDKQYEILKTSQVDLLTINDAFKGDLVGNAEVMEKVDLENEEKQENLESIHKENHDIKTKLTELEQLKEKTEKQLKILEESHQISLSKIVTLEGRLAENNAKNIELIQNVKNLTKKLENTERELQVEQAQLKTILNEKNDLVQKYEKINNKIQNDNVNHINMYLVYERKIAQMKTETKQVKDETVRLNNNLQTKEEIVNQYITRNNQLEYQLKVSKEENNKLSQQLAEKSNNFENFKLENNNKQTKYESLIQQLTDEVEKNTKSRNLEDKDYHDNLDSLNNEMKNKIEEYLSNICSAIKEKNLLTPVSIDLSNKINDLDLSISNILEKFYTNWKIIDENFLNDFKSNFSKILIIKRNLELLNKIDSIDVGNSGNDEIDNVSHINMYQIYEHKFGQMQAKIVNQRTEKTNQLENRLISFSQEEINIKSQNSVDKESPNNLERINNEMKDKIEEFLSNIYPIIKEKDLLTPVSIDLSKKINDLDLSISNILEQFYTNFQNDFKINLSKILIIKRNLELLNKINSIDVGNSGNDEIDSNSNFNEIQNFFDSIEFLNQNLCLKITETCNDFKLSEGKSLALIKEIDNENMNKLSTYVKDNLILIKKLLNERNSLKEKLVELKRSVIECLAGNEVAGSDNLGH